MGAGVGRGDGRAPGAGRLAPSLSGERIALNFLQRLSGIASATRRLVDAVAGLDVRILDTRKTTPGLRALERYAVRVGGGQNHRFDLGDGVLIKDNHLAAARARGLTIAQVIEGARADAPEGMPVEIEVTSVAEAREALAGDADIVLLDNMPVEEMRMGVEAARGRALLAGQERTLSRWIGAGRFPPPDLRIGKSLRWRRSTILAWVAEKMAG